MMPPRPVPAPGSRDRPAARLPSITALMGGIVWLACFSAGF
jgi:hypothetical protein